MSILPLPMEARRPPTISVPRSSFFTVESRRQRAPVMRAGSGLSLLMFSSSMAILS